MEKQLKLILISGVPGSGKTWLAKKILKENNNNGWMFSADDYFMNENNEYIFKPEEIGLAHEKCFHNFHMACERINNLFPDHMIIIHNTFTKNWEISPYVAVTNMFRFKYQIIRIKCSAEDGIRRNVHNVPAAVIRNMEKRMEAPIKGWNFIEVGAEGI